MLYIKFQIKDPIKFQAFQKVYELLFEIKPKEESRPPEQWNQLFPDHVKEHLAAYYNDDLATPVMQRWSFQDMVNYLEFGLEVDFEYLTTEGCLGEIGYKALAFPYGGLDRLLIFLKSFDCIPIESYTGFSVVRIAWTGTYEYEATELLKETKSIRKNEV